MSNKYKTLLAIICVTVSVIVFYWTTDMPGTANYSKGPVDLNKMMGVTITIVLVCAAIIIGSSVSVSGSDDDEI